MKVRLACVVGLGLLGSVAAATAQPYGGYGPGPGYGDRGYRDRDYGDRGYRGRGYDEDDRGGYGGGGRRSVGFNEREYLRCNADVRRALQAGQITSAYDHFQQFGRREGRRLTC